MVVCVHTVFYVFFFFKQKTAYELRISDWSSDVCSSDLLDARRCISYLTIELKGPIPAEFRENIGNRIYGCDDCLAVCPWNKFAAAARANLAFAPRAELTAPRLADLLAQIGRANV